MRRMPKFTIVCVLTLLALSHSRTLTAAPVAEHDAVTPIARTGAQMERHLAINERAKQGDVDLIFLGDSITQGWERNGAAVWQKHYGHRNAMNAGIGGDRTQHVLWRLDNGNIDGLNPKLAVMMIGTNNSRDNQPEETIDGVTAIVEKLREKLPETKILILGIFPRGATAGDELRNKNEAVNEQIKDLADGEMVYYLDIGKEFTEPDGSLSKEIMPDLLHLSDKGYTIWAESIEPTVSKLMGE